MVFPLIVPQNKNHFSFSNFILKPRIICFKAYEHILRDLVTWMIQTFFNLKSCISLNSHINKFLNTKM